MALIKTRFENYFIDNITFKVFSNKTGIIKPLKESLVYNTKRNNAKPYIQVGVQGCSLLHRLIADTFIQNVHNLTVNHINGNTLDNSLENLEVISMKDNWNHAIKTGLIPLGENHCRAKYSDDLLIKALKEFQIDNLSIKTIAKKYGISQSYLNKVKNKVYRAYLMESLCQ